MKKFLFVLLLILGGVAGVLFSTLGQERVLVPLANFYLKHRVAEPRIVLTRLEPGIGSLKIEGTVDRTILFSAEGPVHWIGPELDLDYRVQADEVLLGGKRYPLQLALRGTLKGTPDALQVAGEGRGFSADLRYRFRLQESEIRSLEARAVGARVDQLLALAGIHPYATGKLDLKVDLPSLDSKNPQGTARFSVAEGRIDPKALKRDFGIDLPQVEGYRLDGAFRLDRGLIRGEAALESPLLRLKLTRFRSDPLLRIFKSGYEMEIPELSQLSSLTGTTLYGPWKMAGEFYHDRSKGTLQLKGESPSLEGATRFLYDGKRLTLSFQKAGIPQLVALLGLDPLVASGRFDGKLRVADLKAPRGEYSLRAKGAWDRAELAKLLGSDPGTMLDFTLQSDGRLAKGVLDAKARYRNALVNLDLPKLRYALQSGAFEGEYRLTVPQLSRLALFAGREAGAFEVTGRASYLPIKKLLKVEGLSDSLGGESRFVYGGKRLRVELKKVDGVRLLRLAGLPPLLSVSRVDGTLQLSDLERRIGKFSLSASGIANRKVWKEAWQLDPGAKAKFQLKSQGTLRGNQLEAKANLQSPFGRVELPTCRYRFDGKACRGSYRLEIPELSRLRSLMGRSYHGPLRLAGQIAWDGSLHLDGAGREWGGRLEYRLEGDLLRVKASHMQAKDLMKMLGYPALVEGRISSDLRYNLKSQKGTLGAELSQAAFVRSTLTMVASRVLKYDLAKERFEKVRFSSRIDGPQVIFNLDARSKHLLVTVQKGKFDRAKGSINAVVSIEEGNKRYRFKLAGPLSRPRVIPLMTQDLVQKATQELKKHKVGRKIEKAIPKELKEPGNPVSDFLKKLF